MTCACVAPTVTFPNASLEGLSASDPPPVPDRATVWVPSDASLVMDSVAANVAAALGVNEMFRVVLCPAASDTGSVGEVSEKYLVETDAPLILRVLVPELVAVSVRLLFVLGATLPKSRAAFPSTRVPICCAPATELDSLNPWQPTRTAKADRVSTAVAAFPIRAMAGLLAGLFRITFTNCIPLYVDASDAGGFFCHFQLGV